MKNCQNFFFLNLNFTSLSTDSILFLYLSRKSRKSNIIDNFFSEIYSFENTGKTTNFFPFLFFVLGSRMEKKMDPGTGTNIPIRNIANYTLHKLFY